MACITPLSQSQPLYENTPFTVLKKSKNQVCAIPFSRITQSSNLCEFGVVKKPKNQFLEIPFSRITQSSNLCVKKSRMVLVSATTTAEKSSKRYPGEAKGFVEEMRFVAMKLHTKDQAKEGEKEAEGQPLAKWEPTVEGYLKFLVDSKLVYDTLEKIVEKAPFPEYAEFRNTGLERSAVLAKDLEWFRQQGHAIPEPSTPGVSYAHYLEELSEKDPQAFICHFYNTYFAHSAGGRMIGRKNWTREEKNHYLEQTEKSFKFSGAILRLIFS